MWGGAFEICLYKQGRGASRRPGLSGTSHRDLAAGMADRSLASATTAPLRSAKDVASGMTGAIGRLSGRRDTTHCASGSIRRPYGRLDVKAWGTLNRSRKLNHGRFREAEKEVADTQRQSNRTGRPHMRQQGNDRRTRYAPLGRYLGNRSPAPRSGALPVNPAPRSLPR